MENCNPTNERVKRDYVEYLRHADGKAETTIRQFEQAILRYENFTGFADFKKFSQRLARAFKKDLASRGLSKATTLSIITRLKRFFGWLSMQPGYKRRIASTDIDYLSLSDKDIRAAKSPADKCVPTLRQIEHVVQSMPAVTPVEKRNRALIAFTAITGIRDGALISLKLKHVDLDRGLVLQNPTEVATKASKPINTFFFPVNKHFERLVMDWVRFLREEQLFADQDPLFPKTAIGFDVDDCFTVKGLSREHWSTASPVRDIFKAAITAAGLPAYTPHRLRDMIVSEMYARELSVAECKAWSQNLGHEGAMTTLTSYGKLSIEEQGRLVRSAHKAPREHPLTLADLEDVLDRRGLG